MKVYVADLRQLIRESISNDSTSLTQQVAKRIRKQFLSDPAIWPEFESKKDLQNWLLDFPDDLENLLIRWAKRQINKEELLRLIEIDKLWSLAEESIYRFYDENPDQERPARWRR